MADPVNLRLFRKRKQRENKALEADANRKLHGLPLAARKQAREKTRIESLRLDGKKLGRDD